MVELLQLALQDFWHFAGCVVFLSIVCIAMVGIFVAANPSGRRR